MNTMGQLNSLIIWVYGFIQALLARIFSPNPPPPRRHLHGPRIAVIGAGITGINSAAHCVGHGFEVTIFEAGSREQLGGIWSRVNNTSNLQVYSALYRFFPSICARRRYPDRRAIVREVTGIWEQYGLDERTEFDVHVSKVWKDETSNKWIVQNERFGHFDGVIGAGGTCGDPKMPRIPGQDEYTGDLVHSSNLAGKDAKGKNVVVVGSGANAVEAIEFAVKKEAARTTVLARSDKWMIPRNPIVDILSGLNCFGEESIFSWAPEMLLRRLFFRDLKDLAPARAGRFTESPLVSEDALSQVYAGRVEWLSGDIQSLDTHGAHFVQRAHGVPKGGPGRHVQIPADMIIMATGFQRPDLCFLPQDAFAAPYVPPDWFLQTFPVGYPDVCTINAVCVNSVGALGGVHIGLYTRILLMFLADPRTRPGPALMRTWVDAGKMAKSAAPKGASDLVAYLELIGWVLTSMFVEPSRWKWILFVLFGWGGALPDRLPEEEGLVNWADRVDQEIVLTDKEFVSALSTPLWPTNADEKEDASRGEKGEPDGRVEGMMTIGEKEEAKEREEEGSVVAAAGEEESDYVAAARKEDRSGVVAASEAESGVATMMSEEENSWMDE